VTTAPADVDVETTLLEYARLTRRVMERYLPNSGTAGDAGLAPLVRDYPDRPGKGIRPSLLLASCEGHGGSVRAALGPAVAVEMLHNAFLIHDDLEDESVLRRRGPTLHRLHGVPLAVNAGDALALLALAALNDRSELGTRLGERVTSEVLEMARLATVGQDMELQWRRHNVVDLAVADYLDLVLHKSCSYTTMYPLRIGAIIGTHGAIDDGHLADLSAFGFYLGAAFQIRDDLLNLTGSVERYGKEVLGDLHEGKRTLPLIHVLGNAGDRDRVWLAEYLARPIEDRSATEAEHLLGLMRRYGSIELATTWQDAIAAAAYDAFETAFGALGSGRHIAFLRAMVPYMVERTS
jgi:geranylgeranyl diphosphate synthase, type II